MTNIRGMATKQKKDAKVAAREEEETDRILLIEKQKKLDDLILQSERLPKAKTDPESSEADAESDASSDSYTSDESDESDELYESDDFERLNKEIIELIDKVSTDKTIIFSVNKTINLGAYFNLAKYMNGIFESLNKIKIFLKQTTSYSNINNDINEDLRENITDILDFVADNQFNYENLAKWISDLRITDQTIITTIRNLMLSLMQIENVLPTVHIPHTSSHP